MTYHGFFVLLQALKHKDRNKMYNNNHFTTNNPPCQA